MKGRVEKASANLRLSPRVPRSRRLAPPASLQGDLFNDSDAPSTVKLADVVAKRVTEAISQATETTLANAMKPTMRAAPSRPEDLIDVRAAAARLGLSKSTLDKMRCYGVGPPFIRSTERAVRYDPADLDAYKNARRSQSKADRST